MDRDVLDKSELVTHGYFIRVVSRLWLAYMPGFRTIASDLRATWSGGGVLRTLDMLHFSAAPKTQSFVQRSGTCSALDTEIKRV